MSLHVHLDRFEGPLGLLLYLIREQEMDIFDINIHQITSQYLEYIKTMRQLDLEVAGDFVAMAATLLQIKSRMLLPQYTEEGEEVHEDPRKELVQKLVEYKKIKELSVDLYKLPLLGRDVFTRGERTDIESLEEGELIVEENPLFSLISSYRTAMKNMKKTIHRVFGELQSIASRIMEMRVYFQVGRRVVMRDLITDNANRGSQVLVTFLSLLELAKMGFVSLFQAEPFADLHIDPKKPIDTAVVSQVESYDSVNAEQKAEEILVEAQMSLDESAVISEDMADAPVVEETFADAATDEEILAEEARLFAPEGETPIDTVVDEAVVEVPIEAVSEAPEEVARPITKSVSDSVAAALAAADWMSESAVKSVVEIEPTLTDAVDFAAPHLDFVEEAEIKREMAQDPVEVLEAIEESLEVGEEWHGGAEFAVEGPDVENHEIAEIPEPLAAETPAAPLAEPESPPTNDIAFLTTPDPEAEV
ncbi:MAG: segregation/condensation protein A [Bdellovibrionales bacterium]